MNIELLLQNSFHSLFRVFIGVSFAFFLGIAMGFLRSSLPAGFKRNALLNFIFEAPKFPPPIAWIPFVILLAGIGNISAVIIVFIGAFSPIFTSAYDAAESIPEILKSTAQTFEINGLGYYYKIVLPYTLPRIFSGLRSAVSMGWMSVIAAEMVSGQSGLGYSIQLNRLNLDYSNMVAEMFMIAGIGYMLSVIVEFLEKKFVCWRPVHDVKA